MLPSCKQVAEHLSENIDKPLTGMKWFKMKLHLILCEVCRRYGEQLEISCHTVKRMAEENKPSEELTENVNKKFKEIHCENKQEK